MSNNIDIKTLEAFQDGNHKAFETVFIAYYNGAGAGFRATRSEERRVGKECTG